MIGCEDDLSSGNPNNVTFNSVSANGSSSVTTTQLTLSFSKAIDGLTAGDITLSGVAGVGKGTLSGSGGTYTLSIGGFTEGGTLTVAVAKANFTINNPSRTVAVYFSNPTPVTFSSVTANGSATSNTTQLTLTFSREVAGLSASDITLSNVTGVTKGSLSGPSGSGTMYTLSISGFSDGGTLSVAVAKAGYTITGSPLTVPIFHTATIDFKVTANGGPDTSSITTTQLLLTFDEEITGLTASNISLSGMTGVTKGTLSGEGDWYTLPISGFSVGGTLNVTVTKTGITTSVKTVIIYHKDSPTVSLASVTADGNDTLTTTQLTLTFSAPISGLTASNITLDGVTGVTKGTLTAGSTAGTYTLPISGFTSSGDLKVTVEKPGYNITNLSTPRKIYYATAVTLSVSADSPTNTTFLSLTFSKEIPGLSVSDISLIGVAVTKGSLTGPGGSSGTTYNLEISGFTGSGTLTVTVTKTGYSITTASNKVTIGSSSSSTAVTLNSVTANGSTTQTTTELTLTFSAAITGLATNDIILSGVTGVSKGTLTAGSPAGKYTLPISGFTSGGNLSVSVSKTGYTINGSPQTATIYYYNTTTPPATPLTVSGTTVTKSTTGSGVSDTTTTLSVTITFSGTLPSGSVVSATVSDATATLSNSSAAGASDTTATLNINYGSTFVPGTAAIATVSYTDGSSTVNVATINNSTGLAFDRNLMVQATGTQSGGSGTIVFADSGNISANSLPSSGVSADAATGSGGGSSAATAPSYNSGNAQWESTISNHNDSGSENFSFANFTVTGYNYINNNAAPATVTASGVS
jgi:hypothetical protein